MPTVGFVANVLWPGYRLDRPSALFSFCGFDRLVRLFRLFVPQRHDPQDRQSLPVLPGYVLERGSNPAKT
jgi:hypothetical protein